jgi:hypothetical protein
VAKTMSVVALGQLLNLLTCVFGLGEARASSDYGQQIA